MDDFSREIEIHAPLELCYQLWRDIPHYLTWNPEIKSVAHLQDNIWRSTTTGTHGDAITWDLLLIPDVPNHRLFCKTINGPAFEIMAEHRFVKIKPDLTKLIMQTSFHPTHTLLSGLYEELYAWSPEATVSVLKAFKAYAEGIYKQTLTQEQAHYLSPQERQSDHSVTSR